MMKRRIVGIRMGGSWTYLFTARCGHQWVRTHGTSPGAFAEDGCHIIERMLNRHEAVCDVIRNGGNAAALLIRMEDRVSAR